MATHPMTGKTVLVTGSTDGIGRQTAVELAALGADVLRARPRRAPRSGGPRGRAGPRRPAAPPRCTWPISPRVAGVRELGARVRDRARAPRRAGEQRRRLLARAPRHRRRSRAHLRRQRAGAVRPRAELLPLLRAAAPVAHRQPQLGVALDRRDALGRSAVRRRRTTAVAAYDQSKLAVTLLTFELARRLEGSGVTPCASIPATSTPKMLRAGWPELPGIDVVAGAATSVYLASSPDVAGVSGVYYEDGRETAPLEASLRARSRRSASGDILEGARGRGLTAAAAGISCSRRVSPRRTEGRPP